MDRLVVNIQPFLKNQTVQYYKDNILDSEHLTDIRAIPDIIKSYCKTDDIKQIDFFGSRIFALRFKTDILKFTEFEKLNDVNITIH